VPSERRYLRSPSEGSEIASTSSPVFFSFSLSAMSAWATMPTSLPFSTTGQPPNLVAGHELERLFEVFVGLNTDEVPRVDLADRRHLRVCGLGDHSRRDVSVGDHPDKLLVVGYRERAD
jgi:hypothetical protein